MFNKKGKDKVQKNSKNNGLFALINVPVTFIVELFTLAFVGAKELGFCFIDIFRYAYIAFKRLIIDTLANLYFASSNSVDRAYKSTKKVLGVNNQKKNIKKGESKFQKIYNEFGFVKNQKAKLEAEKKKLQEELAGADAKRLSKPTVYRYKARDPHGKVIYGNFTGFSKLDVNAFLVNEGYDVYSIETSKWINFIYGDSGILATRMKNKDLIFWLTQLSTYVKSGIPLTDSVRILANQMGNNGGRKRVFDTIVYELTMGESFSKALEKQGSMFPSLLINMLKAAEATGELEETLDDMANYYTEVESTRKQMVSAMSYPTIITVFAGGVLAFIMLYVIPQFTKIYDQTGAEINGLTLFLINFSDFLKNYYALIVLLFVVAILGFYFMYKQIKAFRKTIQVALMRTPIIGKIIIYNEMTIFTKTFSSLLRNNVFITESIDILSKITNNEVYKEIMFKTISNIATGGKISETFKDHWAVPDVAYFMIVTGESTGELADMMGKVSKYYQEQHSTMVSSLKSFIEPVMIASLAIVVGIIILAVIMPMYGMYDAISM